MSRVLWLLLLGALLALGPSAALAQRVHVAIVGVRGKGGGASAVSGLQGALQKLKDISFESTRNFLAEAEQRGVADKVESDPKAMSQVARALEVDAVVRGTLEEAQRSKAKTLTLSVYNGGNGKLLGEEVIDVPGGKLTPKVFTQAARAIEPYLRMGEHKSAFVEEPSAPVAAPVTPLRNEVITETEPEEAPAASGERRDFVRVSAGLAMRKRNFKYAVHPETAATVDQFLFVPDGISYESDLSPGVGVSAEIYPLALTMTGPVTGIGLVASYEKIFLGTKQKVVKEDDSVTTSELTTIQSLLDAGLRYRYGFGSAETGPEIQGTVGMAWSTFELENNDEYKGTNYRYLHVGAGGRIPFGTPLAAAEIEVRYLPMIDLGDTAKELGKSVDASGYGFTAGVVSQFGPGLLAQVGFDYTAIAGDVKGEGRGVDTNGDDVEDKVRHGKSMEDSYLGIHARVGYHF